MDLFSTLPSVTTNRYTLSFIHTKGYFYIQGTILTAPISTDLLPDTYAVLERYLPQIFSSQCYNDKQLPFSKELLRTETSHLLEHILLEYLCNEKLKNGACRASFSGVTRWYVDSPQQFEITIKKKNMNQMLLLKALKQSLYIFDQILKTEVISTDSFLTNQINSSFADSSLS